MSFIMLPETSYQAETVSMVDLAPPALDVDEGTGLSNFMHDGNQLHCARVDIDSKDLVYEYLLYIAGRMVDLHLVLKRLDDQAAHGLAKDVRQLTINMELIVFRLANGEVDWNADDLIADTLRTCVEKFLDQTRSVAWPPFVKVDLVTNFKVLQLSDRESFKKTRQEYERTIEDGGLWEQEEALCAMAVAQKVKMQRLIDFLQYFANVVAPTREEIREEYTYLTSEARSAVRVFRMAPGGKLHSFEQFSAEVARRQQLYVDAHRSIVAQLSE